MNSRILLLLALVTIPWSCQPESQKETLPSGYEYILHTIDNDGKQSEPEAMAFFNYAMRNDEGTVTSSYATVPQILPIPAADDPRPVTPVEEALKVMRIGDSLTIIVPLDTIPVDQRPQGFESSKFLYYDISLEDLKLKSDLDESVKEVEAIISTTIDQYQAGTLEGLQTTETGLKYYINEQGTGEIPVANDYVYVNYYGTLTDKTMFDNSFQKGMPFPFPLKQGRVIPGWDEGIGLLNVGTKATLFIPSELGYGENGAPPTIPGGAELVFYVELVSATKPN